MPRPLRRTRKRDAIATMTLSSGIARATLAPLVALAAACGSSSATTRLDAGGASDALRPDDAEGTRDAGRHADTGAHDADSHVDAGGSRGLHVVMGSGWMPGHVVDASGNVVQLHGVDRSGTEYACVQGWGLFDGPSDQASITAMKATTRVAWLNKAGT